MEEVFREIPGFAGYYVSNLGNVMSTKRGDTRLLSINKSRLGYATVIFYIKGMKMMYVSRLVLEAFYGYPADPWLCVAHHKDGDLTNCSLDNLEWVVCETTEEYDPEKSHRKGVLKPDFTKQRMTEAKLHQSPESLRKGAEKRRLTCLMRNK